MTYYDKLFRLCSHMYKQTPQDFENWKLVDSFSADDGLFVSIFKTDADEYVFSVRGSELFTGEDLESDIQMAERVVPNRYKTALKYYNDIKNSYSPLIFTGYSLGGSIAQMLGNEFGNETICFEPFGVGGMVSTKHTNNIVNFGNWYDIIFIADFAHQLGDIYIMNVEPTKNGKAGFKRHRLEYCGKPSNSSQYKGERSNDSVYQDLLDVSDRMVRVNQKIQNKCVAVGHKTMNTLHTGKSYVKRSSKNLVRNTQKVLNTMSSKLTDKAKQVLLQGGISITTPQD